MVRKKSNDQQRYRDYPVRVKLNEEDIRIFDNLCNDGTAPSDILRNALELAFSNQDILEEYIFKRRLKSGESIFRYDGTNNDMLLKNLVNTKTGALRCSVMFVFWDSKIYCGRGINGITVGDGYIEIRTKMRANGSLLESAQFTESVISIKAEDISRVTTVNGLTGQETGGVPLRFESISELEYLEIVMR